MEKSFVSMIILAHVVASIHCYRTITGNTQPQLPYSNDNGSPISPPPLPYDHDNIPSISPSPSSYDHGVPSISPSPSSYDNRGPTSQPPFSAGPARSPSSPPSSDDTGNHMNQPPPSPSHTSHQNFRNVLDYGAKGNGQDDDSQVHAMTVYITFYFNRNFCDSNSFFAVQRPLRMHGRTHAGLIPRLAYMFPVDERISSCL